MSSSETFEFFDERVALLFVGFTVWNTNGDCAAVIELVYRDNCIRLLGVSGFLGGKNSNVSLEDTTNLQSFGKQRN